ncbi:uncharacterized protein [Rutidosis leptorrhynchoides]|uniref:uncharacterized protein n=1 Tax=Rutidosis leptorrhynchoides TaxID=125765 RepID=UPI003A98D6C5
MPSPDTQDSFKSSSKKKNNKKKRKSTDKEKNSKKKKKSDDKKNNDDKSSSLPLSWLPSNARHALSPPRKGENKSNIILIGAAIGAALFFLFMILCMVCCCRRKKRKQKNNKEYSFNNHGITKDNNNNGYYNKQPHDSNQHQQNIDLHLKMPPPPSASSSAPNSEQWVAVPPPPPPGMFSSEMSSSSYSGPYQAPLPPPHPGISVNLNTNNFSYDELAAATKGFDRSLLLGQGGFGYVHKGVLSNGKEVAVKSLKIDSGQGEREFQAEVEIISRVHHRHLVSLVGYCIAGQQRILVYEFIPNKTLYYHIHGEGARIIDCSTRLQIALGAAKGFAYLHEDCNPRIIHRDIKAANILLDENYEAKVADFGLAKLSSETITHVSTRIMGTFGYLAPEYASTGKLTEKSDVFSYGVVLLELITGRRPINRHSDDEDNLIDWARPILMQASNGGSFEELVDPRLENNYDRDEMHRMVACAASAIKHSGRMRPTMRQIVRMLEGDGPSDDLNDVGKNVRKGNLDYDKNGDMTSGEFSSNEYSRVHMIDHELIMHTILFNRSLRVQIIDVSLILCSSFCLLKAPTAVLVPITAIFLPVEAIEHDLRGLAWHHKVDLLLAQSTTERLKDLLEEYKINNAGTNKGFKPLLEFTDIDIQIVSTNLVGSILCTREAMHVMSNQHKVGHIFNMDGAGSGGSSTPLTTVQLQSSLLKEYKKSRVVVHTASPGMWIDDSEQANV